MPDQASGAAKLAAIRGCRLRASESARAAHSLQNWRSWRSPSSPSRRMVTSESVPHTERRVALEVGRSTSNPLASAGGASRGF